MATSHLDRRLKSLEAGNGGIQMVIGDEDFLANEQIRLIAEVVPGRRHIFVLDEFNSSQSCIQQDSCREEAER